MKNAKTTGLGIGSLLVVIGGLMQQFFSGGEISGADIGVAISAIMSAIGLIFAKDATTPQTLLSKTTEIKTGAWLFPLLFLFATSSAYAACEPHTPKARFTDSFQMAQAGDTVANEFFIHNVDSCGCKETCFHLSPGWRPPYDGDTGLTMPRRAARVTYQDGVLFPHTVCLKPGESITALLQLTLGAEQALPGHVMENVFLARTHAHKTGDFLIDYFDMESVPVCVGLTIEQCQSKRRKYGPEV